jgi:hypothetical protein
MRWTDFEGQQVGGFDYVGCGRREAKCRNVRLVKIVSCGELWKQLSGRRHSRRCVLDSRWWLG